MFQLDAGFLQASFPALASLDNPELPNNLPMLLSGFVGRERELADVRGLMADSRLVTLTGAGGSGKARLALYRDLPGLTVSRRANTYSSC